MATKKPADKPAKKSKYPIVTVGSHSVRTEHENGRVDFVVDDDKLYADVVAALAEYEDTNVQTKSVGKVKPARTKKTKE